jgi:hypothetical protein
MHLNAQPQQFLSNSSVGHMFSTHQLQFSLLDQILHQTCKKWQQW